MIKNILAAVALIIAVASPAFSWDIDAMNKTVDNTNFIVGGSCSGTLIDNRPGRNIILTAAHCIENGKPVIVEQILPGGVDYDITSHWIADPIARNKEVDLAVLKIRGDHVFPEAAKVASKDYVVRRGERIWIVGNPLMLYNSVNEGVVSYPNRRITDPDDKPGDVGEVKIQFSGGIAPGNSGGAIYNDNGELIGVVSMVFKSYPFIGFAVPFYDGISFDNDFVRTR
jgi:serine protease Do